MNSKYVDDFVTSYHRKHWLDSEECEMISTCLVAKVAQDEQRLEFYANSNLILNILYIIFKASFVDDNLQLKSHLVFTVYLRFYITLSID